MLHIITRINELLKKTNSLVEFEEQVQLLMYDTFADLVGEVFTQLNQSMSFGRNFKFYPPININLKILKLYQIVTVVQVIQLKDFRKHISNQNCLYDINLMNIIFNRV